MVAKTLKLSTRTFAHNDAIITHVLYSVGIGVTPPNEATRPEGNVHDDGDEERETVQPVEKALVARDCAVESLTELDHSEDGTDLCIF